MYLSTEYEKLIAVITEVQPVAEDVHSDQRVRNIIFELEDDKCTIVGVSGFITFR